MTSPRQNIDECRAKQWLELQGYTDIRRPSDDPPDYIVEGRYAAEVRRLNYSEDERTTPLHENIERVLAKLGPSTDGKTVFVSCGYPHACRLPHESVVEKEIKCALKPHRWREGGLLQLDCGISLRFHTPIPSGSLGHKFELNAVYVGPPRWGGVGDLSDNISRCIEEKSGKVRNKNRVHDYPCWWLLLIDHIHYVPSLNENQLNTLREAIRSRDFWSRIVIIGSEKPERFYQL